MDKHDEHTSMKEPEQQHTPDIVLVARAHLQHSWDHDTRGDIECCVMARAIISDQAIIGELRKALSMLVHLVPYPYAAEARAALERRAKEGG
jgi:hypothetical protein